MNGQCRGSRGLFCIGVSSVGVDVTENAVPWIGYGCVIDRTTVGRSITLATWGNPSHNCFREPRIRSTAHLRMPKMASPRRSLLNNAAPGTLQMLREAVKLLARMGDE